MHIIGINKSEKRSHRHKRNNAIRKSPFIVPNESLVSLYL